MRTNRCRRCRSAAVRAAAPMQFGAQQPVVVITRRMQQGDLRVGALDVQIVALLEVADGAAVAGDLGARLEAIRHAQLDLAARAHHDGTVAQGMRADGRQHPDIEVGLDDGAAAGQRIGGRAGRGGDHHAVAAMRIDEMPVDRGFEVHGAAGFPLIDHHVVQGEGAHRSRRRAFPAARPAASADPRCSARRARCPRPPASNWGSRRSRIPAGRG